MSESDRIILIGILFTYVHLAILGLTLKLYTEFIKEKKYREP